MGLPRQTSKRPEIPIPRPQLSVVVILRLKPEALSGGGMTMTRSAPVTVTFYTDKQKGRRVTGPLVAACQLGLLLHELELGLGPHAFASRHHGIEGLVERDTALAQAPFVHIAQHVDEQRGRLVISRQVREPSYRLDAEFFVCHDPPPWGSVRRISTLSISQLPHHCQRRSESWLPLGTRRGRQRDRQRSQHST